jgi:predicted NUDIX family NTP pyrophosphohydrolase
LVHPGGPYWKNRDKGCWSIPKGEINENEDALQAAIREFSEETGKRVSGRFIKLVPVTQKSGKRVHAWAIEQNINLKHIISNSFEMEWPPKSGTFQQFPEVDKASWFLLNEAKEKINTAQVDFLNQLEHASLS